MLPSDQQSKDGGTWITVQPTVTVPAKDTKVEPLTITVPSAATPGDHPAGIAASIVSNNGGPVQIESRVGFRVMTRVSGTVRPALSAEVRTARYVRSWNPFRAGTVRVSHTVANTGNVGVQAGGTVAVSSLFLTNKRRADAGELLPGGSRTVDTRVGGVWSLGRVTTTVTATPGAQGEPGTATVTVWALPWPQLLLALLLAAAVILLRTVVRHRHRKLTRLLAQARAQGRREATTRR
jgi:energy-converting hydrogenase Eha subunit B